MDGLLDWMDRQLGRLTGLFALIGTLGVLSLKDLWIIGGFRTDHGPCMLLAGFQWEVCWICFCTKRRIGSDRRR